MLDHERRIIEKGWRMEGAGPGAAGNGAICYVYRREDSPLVGYVQRQKETGEWRWWVVRQVQPRIDEDDWTPVHNGERWSIVAQGFERDKHEAMLEALMADVPAELEVDR